ncbi:hypothetical protein U1Q18_052367 [Sarracenia purpurea var. burkii]
MPTAHLTLKSSYRLWHDCLGHPNHNVLAQILKHDRLHSQPPTLSSTSSLCSHCLAGKMHSLPFCLLQQPLSISFNFFTHVRGPSPITSVSGYRYYVSFVDDFTRFTWLFP